MPPDKVGPRLAEPSPCRTIVLAGDGSAYSTAALLERVLADPDVRGGIEVFAAPGPPDDPRPRHHRLRWHPPTADLVRALSLLAPELERGGSPDVAYVRAGVRVFAGWQPRLRAALQADPRIATACPLCPADPMYSPFGRARRVPRAADGLDAWLAARGDAAPIELPAPLAQCGVLRAAAWRALLRAVQPDGDTASDWGAVLSRSGFVHVVCRRTVAFEEGARAGRAGHAAQPADCSLLAARERWQDAHPLTGLRWHVESASDEWSRAPGTSPLPVAAAPSRGVRLHVAHSWGGGLNSWVRDFCAADIGAENLVLRSIGVIGAFGQRIALYRGGDSVEPIRIWELGVPIHATAIAHLQFRALLAEVVEQFAIDSVLVSSLIGHSLDALRTGLPTAVVAHDHYPLCVAIFAHFGGECRTCDAARLRACMGSNPGHRFFSGVDASDWDALRAAFCDTLLDNDVSLVAPSPSVGDRWRSLMPPLAHARWHEVAHGTNLPDPVPFEPPEGGRLRVLTLGRLSTEKGGDLIASIVPEMAKFVDLTLLGCGEDAARFGRLPGVTAIDAFERDRLPELVAQVQPHLGMQLSIVPETFSYTLTELWHCAVPVLACRVGSLADRIRDGENGYLVSPDAQSVLARLREIDGRRDALVRMRALLRSVATRSCESMVADYDALLSAGPRARHEAAGARVAGAHAAVPPAGHAASEASRVRLGPLSIDPQARYRQAATAFWRYTLDKAAHSPRLPRLLRRVVLRWRT